jgi:hypothetical protein
MRLIVTAELDNLPETVLRSKFYRVQQELAHTKPATTERANALASLENINRAIITRRIKGPGF